ncbi:TPA: hypothetical protein HA265_01675, partial [Candidatus Woesearchaeota archaeon]|nr:hypothetical protein [Candidatus Woesearchaeota archaeon]
ARYGKRLEKLGQDNKANAEKAWEELMAAWRHELKTFRANINAAYEKSKGGTGFARILFDKAHTQGFMMRQQEKRLLHHVMKADKDPDKTAKMLSKVKNADQLKKVLDGLVKSEKETVAEYIKLTKLEMSSWDAYNNLLEHFVEMMCKAAEVHEIPARDSEQMKKLKTMIVGELEEKYFHNLRAVILGQLEAYEAEAEKRLAA